MKKILWAEEIFNSNDFPFAEAFDEKNKIYIIRKRMEINKGSRIGESYQHMGTFMGYVAGKGTLEKTQGIFFSRQLPTEYSMGGNFVAPCEFLPINKINSIQDLNLDPPYISRKK